MDPIKQFTEYQYRWYFYVLVIIALAVAAILSMPGLAFAHLTGGATLLPAARVGGSQGQDDERDSDIYPAVAYDPSTARYLVVWLSARNAGSSSDGLDVYGIFLNQNGTPIGNEFRISDDNIAARSSLPSVAAGNGEFVVAWTAKTRQCNIYAQRVTDSSAKSDRLLSSGATHHHSPSLVYNPNRQRYALTFVNGDDYLPPTLFGATTDDCGNNATSTAKIQAMEFYFSGDYPITNAPRTVSDFAKGTFRPRLAYSGKLQQYLVIWEDRRNAGTQNYRFDVYAQRLTDNMALSGANILLDSGSDYTNLGTSATWTPRPAVAGGDSNFLAIWFNHQTSGDAEIWSTYGRLIPSSGSPGSVFTVTQTTFAQQHTTPPTGFLSATYNTSAHEYLMGMTSHLESLWGYVSFALVQRIDSTGQLLKKDGSVQSQTGVGYSVDADNDDQFSVALTVNPISGLDSTDYLVMYGKHASGQHSQDFDIWGERVRLTGINFNKVYLPLIQR